MSPPGGSHGRRRFLALAGATAGSLAGCTAPSATPPPTGRPDRVSSVAGADLPVPLADLSAGGALGSIDAIDDPAFGPDWTGVEGRTLRPADPVVGVERDGRARAYPLRVVTVHEVVNDRLGGPLLVTYCPLCASAVTAVRRVEGTATVFGVSGLLWRHNLVMFDEATGSLWSQLAATAIRGPATGEGLELVPSTLTAWSDWRGTHPGTEVLLPPPASGTLHGSGSAPGIDRYARPVRDESARPDEGDGPGRFTHVVGVAHGDEARAYPRPAVRDAGGVVNDVVGDLPVVVALTPADTLVAYERRVDDRTLAIAPGDRPGHLRAGGSTWLATTGTAVDGPHEGTRLPHASDTPALFLRSWRDFHPDTTVYGVDG